MDGQTDGQTHKMIIVQNLGLCNFKMMSTGKGCIGKLLQCSIQNMMAERSERFSCNLTA